MALKLTVNRGDLLRALGHAASIVDRKSTIPILSNVVLDATGGNLRLTASDLDLQITMEIPATVEVEGNRAVSAQLLHGIIREFPDGAAVSLNFDGERVHVKCGRSHYKLQSLPSTDFPMMTTQHGMPFEFVAPAKELLFAFKRVEFAQSDETATRPYLCGVFLDMEGDRLCFAANDGYCMAQAFLDAPDGTTAPETGVILPSKLVTTLSRLLADHDGDVGLAFSDKMASLQIGSTALISKLVEGEYPNYRRIIPEADGRSLNIAAADLGAAIRRASLITVDRTRAVRFALTADKLTVSAASDQNGDAVEEAPCVWSSEDFAVGFNSSHLLAALTAAGDGEIEAQFGDQRRPVLFTNPADDSARWVVGTMAI